MTSEELEKNLLLAIRQAELYQKAFELACHQLYVEADIDEYKANTSLLKIAEIELRSKELDDKLKRL